MRNTRSRCSSCWEPWGLNAAEGTFYSNKLGGGAFRKAVLAGYVLTALFCESYGVVTADGTYVRECDYIGWINSVLGITREQLTKGPLPDVKLEVQ